jgi:uncharacterized protein (TIGR03437 family)
VGLYQINVAIPDGVPSGLIDVNVVFQDSLSNTVRVAVQ